MIGVKNTDINHIGHGKPLSTETRQFLLDIVIEGEKACVEEDFAKDESRVTKMLSNQPSEYKLVGGHFPTLMGSRTAEPLYEHAGVRPSSESPRPARLQLATHSKDKFRPRVPADPSF